MVDWEDGTLVQGAYVEIDGIKYPVVMPQYTGNTPLTSENLNKMQADLKKLISESIETGSNNNAEYVKFNNGILIQFGNVQLTGSESRASGGVTYYSAYSEIALPIAFVDTNYMLSTNVGLANMNYFMQGYASVIDNSSIRISLASTANNDPRIVSFIAIGRWK